MELFYKMNVKLWSHTEVYGVEVVFIAMQSGINQFVEQIVL